MTLKMLKSVKNGWKRLLIKSRFDHNIVHYSNLSQLNGLRHYVFFQKTLIPNPRYPNYIWEIDGREINGREINTLGMDYTKPPWSGTWMHPLWVGILPIAESPQIDIREIDSSGLYWAGNWRSGKRHGASPKLSYKLLYSIRALSVQIFLSKL